MKRRALLGTVGLAAANAGCLRFASSGGATTTVDDQSGGQSTDATPDAETDAPAPEATARDVTASSGSSAAGLVTAYDRDDGTERWRFQAPRDGRHHHAAFLATHDDAVFVGSDDDGSGDEQDPLVFALDADTGEARYVVDDLPAGFINGLFVHDDLVYTSLVEGTLHAFAPEDGTTETTLSIPFGFATPAVVDGEFYTSGEETVRVDLDSGRQRWSTSMPASASPRVRPIVTDDVVVVATRGGHVAALDRATGEKRWQERAAAQIQSLSAGPTAFWVSDDGGTVYAYDRTDGTELYRERSDDGDERPLAVVDDLLCVAEPKLSLHRIEGRDGDSVVLSDVWTDEDEDGFSNLWPRENRFYVGWREVRGYGPDGPTGPTFGPIPEDYWPRAFEFTDSLALVGTMAADD
jgi:outer membrane protein assembly factor BamB